MPAFSGPGTNVVVGFQACLSPNMVHMVVYDPNIHLRCDCAKKRVDTEIDHYAEATGQVEDEDSHVAPLLKTACRAGVRLTLCNVVSGVDYVSSS